MSPCFRPARCIRRGRHGRPDLVSVYRVPCTVYSMTASCVPVFQASTVYDAAVTAVQALCPCTVYRMTVSCVPRVSGQHGVRHGRPDLVSMYRVPYPVSPCFRPARRTSRPSRPCVRVPCTVYRVPCTVYRMTVSCVPRVSGQHGVRHGRPDLVSVYRVPCTVYRVLYDRVLCLRVSGQHGVRLTAVQTLCPCTVYRVPCTVYRMTVSCVPVFQASTTYVTAVQTLCPCTVYRVPCTL